MLAVTGNRAPRPDRLRVLALTRIFPNRAEPLSSPFNRQQFAALARLCDLEVLATIPWFPGIGLRRRGAPRIPDQDVIDGIAVRHPRTLYVPRVHALAGALYAASVAPALLRYRGRVDVILGSWAYPDACAAVALAPLLGAPAVVKLHGSDVNVIANLPGVSHMVRAALPRASRVVAVSRALAAEAEDLGVARERIEVIYNGVDASLFHPRDRAGARQRLGLPADRRLVVYVGNLKATKGVLDLGAAFAKVAPRAGDVDLAIVGGGPDQRDLAAAVAPLGKRVHLAGARPLDEIPDWMAACDVLTLPSWREGTPNVVLEALACGRRVVATSVGGVPDLITSPTAGELVPPRDVEALAEALLRVARETYEPARVQRACARGGWDDSAAALHRVLVEAAAA